MKHVVSGAGTTTAATNQTYANRLFAGGGVERSGQSG